MTILDLTGPPVTRESCYEPISDPTLPHQMVMRWEAARKCKFFEARCNCGHSMGFFQPEKKNTMGDVKRLYAEHVESLL